MDSKIFQTLLSEMAKAIPQDAPSMQLRKSFHRTPYTILMATLLSLRTRDENTARVCRVLFPMADTPQKMVTIPLAQLEQIVKPTGMYRKKAEVLHEVSQTLIDHFGGEVPADKTALLSIRGIGEKTANIVMNNAFGIPTIAVDTHVHRIVNLLGVVGTKTEKETLRALEAKLPRTLWSHLNFTVVSFGQTICLPKNPQCDRCPIRSYCPAATP